MSYYVISIGGSGAKCVESLLHLGTAGLIPDGELNIIFIDPDKANGSLQRAQKTLQQYCDCKKNDLGFIDLFKTQITVAKPNVWSPFGEAQPTLENFFHYDILKTQNEAAAHLFDVLYSPTEKEVVLDEGFLGHPSIGAAVMAKTVRLSENEPWKTFRDKIAIDSRSGSESKIILVGSIFGGTGASGLPTISRLIREEFRDISNIKIGGILILPYFSFLPVEKEVRGGKKFKLNSENFILNTQAALRYYYNQDYLRNFDSAYLLGEHAMVPVKQPSLGGKSQTNDPHFLEIYASLAAVDFFSIDDDMSNESFRNYQYKLVAREDYQKLEWSDLPDRKGGNLVKQKLGKLARFAFAYLNVYYPMLKYIKEEGESYKAPWFVEFFERKNVPISNDRVQGNLIDVKNYCETFLEWFANIHKSSEELKVNFLKYHAFAEKEDESMDLLEPDNFKYQDFGNLILPYIREKPNALTRLWHKMCDAKVRDPNANGVGRFIHALYRES